MRMQDDTAIRAGVLEIRPDEFVAYCKGRRLALTARELAVLTELARRSDRVVAREELYNAVWHRPLRPGDRSVDVYVRKLRAKLARACEEPLIHTHFGFGYRLAAGESSGLSQLLHNGVTTA
jgi:DNA-binding response OmpR family regulator